MKEINNNYVAAIDIGTTKIVAIIGKKNEHNKLEIVGFSSTKSTGVRRGVVINIEETINAIKRVISAVEIETNIKIKEVFVGIAGQHIRSIQNGGIINRNNDEAITEKDLKKLFDDMFLLPVEPDEEIIHVLPQSYLIDREYSEKSPLGMSGRKLEGNFHIVIGKTASANNIKKCIKRADIEVSGLILEPLASSAAVLTKEEKEVGVALVDIGGGTTDIAVFYDNVIRHTAVIPFGGNVITNDIKMEFAITEDIAEKLKTEYGTVFYDEPEQKQIITVPGVNGRPAKEISFAALSGVIQARMEEIIGAILFEIEASNCFNKLGAGIVITGGGSLLNSLPQLISFKSGLIVKIGLPNEHLSGKTEEKINHPMYATTVGLLLEGFDELQKQKIAKSANEPKPEIKQDPIQEPKPEKKSFGSILLNFFDDKKIK
jgi:cell division protein FtsA